MEGRETQADEAALVNRAVVTPQYFHLLGMTLLRGRLFTASDNETAPQVAVINEAAARTYWPNGSALGQNFKRPIDSSWTTVVGVVADARTESMAGASVPEIY